MQSNAKLVKYNQDKDPSIKHVSKNLSRRHSDDAEDLDNM